MKILNRNHLKYIAVVAMLIDHFAHFFLDDIWGTPLYVACRFIGRLTAPIMCYFLTEGFIHTSSRKKYFFRLLIFALISQFAFSFVNNESILDFHFSMIYTLLCCFSMLWSLEYFKNIFLKILSVILFSGIAYIGDWGSMAPIWVLGFYLFRKNNFLRLLPYTLLSGYRNLVLLHTYWGRSIVPALMMSGLLLFIPVILLYNGQPGKKSPFNKWFFYIVYPAHLFLFGLILLFQ